MSMQKLVTLRKLISAAFLWWCLCCSCCIRTLFLVASAMLWSFSYKAWPMSIIWWEFINLHINFVLQLLFIPGWDWEAHDWRSGMGSLQSPSRWRRRLVYCEGENRGGSMEDVDGLGLNTDITITLTVHASPMWIRQERSYPTHFTHSFLKTNLALRMEMIVGTGMGHEINLSVLSMHTTEAQWGE